MGIRLLNKFLKHSCYSDVYSFKQLENKKIVIDIYNYIYRFLGNNRLLEELDILCKLLHKYNIRSLFIFDGKYGEEKKKEQAKRRIQRNYADKQYNKVNEQFRKNPNSLRLKKKLSYLNRERVKLNKWDIHDVKKYLEFSGMKYIIAEGEAEELCSEMVNSNKVYACMSEDTDLFALGCKRIIKNINFKRESFIMYDIDSLLRYLDMSLDAFRMICTLSCNDYVNNNTRKHFIYFINLFNKYIKSQKMNDEINNNDFILWLLHNNYIIESEQQKYFTLEDVYDVSNKNLLKHYKFMSLHNGIYNKRKINTLFVDRRMYLNGSK
jgi:hypothetical protein